MHKGIAYGLLAAALLLLFFDSASTMFGWASYLVLGVLAAIVYAFGGKIEGEK